MDCTVARISPIHPDNPAISGTLWGKCMLGRRVSDRLIYGVMVAVLALSAAGFWHAVLLMREQETNAAAPPKECVISGEVLLRGRNGDLVKCPVTRIWVTPVTREFKEAFDTHAAQLESIGDQIGKLIAKEPQLSSRQTKAEFQRIMEEADTLRQTFDTLARKRQFAVTDKNGCFTAAVPPGRYLIISDFLVSDMIGLTLVDTLIASGREYDLRVKPSSTVAMPVRREKVGASIQLPLEYTHLRNTIEFCRRQMTR